MVQQVVQQEVQQVVQHELEMRVVQKVARVGERPQLAGSLNLND